PFRYQSRQLNELSPNPLIRTGICGLDAADTCVGTCAPVLAHHRMRSGPVLVPPSSRPPQTASATPGQCIRALESFTEMPIYEYRCESCSEKFELLTRFAERDTAQACPACESTRTRVLVSSFAVAGGETSEALDFGTSEGAGGCCGGGCGSCGSSPN